MNAAVGLTLACLHFLVWCHRRSSWANLFFALTAFGTSGYGMVELWVIQSTTVAEISRALWHLHFPGTIIVIGLVGFIRLHLGVGRLWLAWGAIGLRCLGLGINFFSTPNLNFRSITELRHTTFLGETVSHPIGVPSPYMLFSQLGLALLVVFVLDASVTLWRQGSRRSLWLGGSLSFFVLTGSAQLVLVFWGVLNMPITVSMFFFGIVVVMGYEMSLENLKVGQLSDDLRVSESRMALAVEAVGLGLWSWEASRNEIWASSQWRALLGFSPTEPVDFDRWIARLHPDDRQSVQQTLKQANSREGRYEIQYRVQRPDGGLTWISSYGRVDYDSAGRAVRSRGVSKDITQQKETELEVRRQREELAHFSRVTMLGELSATLAHELNQPLGAILRNAEAAELFLQQGSPDLVELKSILRDIRVDDQRAGEVIRRMRSLLRRHEIERVRVDLNALVTEVSALVRPDAQSRKVQLIVDCAPGDHAVQGDRVHLQQVVLNLLLNALDAVKDVPPETRRVTLRVCRVDRQVEVSVRDTGPGIDSVQFTHLFEAFYTTKPNGMGMGLSISRTIVEAHGGRFHVENAEPVGALFRFVLPPSPA
jgi:PAS domain S-box-containing protein